MEVGSRKFHLWPLSLFETHQIFIFTNRHLTIYFEVLD